MDEEVSFAPAAASSALQPPGAASSIRGRQGNQMATTLLKVDGVTKRFGAFIAVNTVSFEVYEGEVLGIAGPNGSGKSTLFNILTAIPSGPDAGAISFAGRPIAGLKPFEIARLGLVRTFQKDSDFKTLSAFDNVMMGTWCCREMPAAEKKTRVAGALERVGFDPAREGRPAGDLSVFDKKLLMIASALVSGPRLLMLDEPASGLTKPEIDALRDLLGGLNRDGLTIVVIEHVLPLLMAVAQRLIVLNEGSILSQGDPQTVVGDERVIAAYLGGQASHARAS
jgi:branched-chain amino acid transport system ATP-binding protein